MKFIFIVFYIFSIVYASQYVTIPKREVGIIIGNRNADVKLQFIYDPICDDSAPFDERFQNVFNSLSQDIKSRISLRFILLSLPYHMAAQKITQGIIYVLQNKGNQQALQLMRDFLLYQQQWYEQNIQDQTLSHLLERIAERISAKFNLNRDSVLKQLAHGSDFDRKTRTWSKFAMGSLRVSGTPTFRINGVQVDGATSLTNEQLSNLIKSFFESSKNENQSYSSQ